MVRRRLVYISTAEMQRVIENFVPEIVTPYLRKAVANTMDVKPYEVWATAEGAKAFADRLRRCLFVGLSDGSPYRRLTTGLTRVRLSRGAGRPND